MKDVDHISEWSDIPEASLPHSTSTYRAMWANSVKLNIIQSHQRPTAIQNLSNSRSWATAYVVEVSLLFKKPIHVVLAFRIGPFVE